MGRLENFESHIENAMDGAAGAVFKSPLNPVQIMRRAEKEMNREKLVSAGRQYAPTLYNVLVNAEDDRKLAGFYPTLAGELETDLKGKAADNGLHMDGAPLVRFIVDDGLKRGKFDIIAENVAAPIVAQLREEEMERYGLAGDAFVQQPVSRREGPSASRRPYPRTPAGQQPMGASPYDFEPEDAENDFVEDGPQWEETADGPDGSPRYAEEGFAADRYQPSPLDIPPAVGVAGYAGTPAGSAHRPSAPAGSTYNRVPSTVRFDTGRSRLVNTRTGETYELSGMRLSLGRERNNNIAIRDANISRSHAELVDSGNGWIIRDLGSTNGTQVNDHPVSQCELHDGDIITVGMTVLEFREG